MEKLLVILLGSLLLTSVVNAEDPEYWLLCVEEDHKDYCIGTVACGGHAVLQIRGDRIVIDESSVLVYNDGKLIKMFANIQCTTENGTVISKGKSNE